MNDQSRTSNNCARPRGFFDFSESWKKHRGITSSRQNRLICPSRRLRNRSAPLHNEITTHRGAIAARMVFSLCISLVIRESPDSVGGLGAAAVEITKEIRRGNT